MGLSTLPTKTDASLGREKVDAPAAFPRVADLRYDVPAEEFERIKQAIIDIAGTIGLSDGTTADSLEEAVDNLDGVIWEWNETDVTQFGSGALYAFVGAANAGTCVLSVTTIRGRPALRATFTGWTGGILFPIASLTLPARFAFEFTIAGVATGPDAFGCANYKNAAGVIDGLLNYRLFGGATHGLYFAVADAASSTTVSFGVSATLVSTDLDDGGMPMSVEYQRPSGSNPAVWSVRVTEAGASSSGIARSSSRASTSAGLPTLTGWNSLDFDLVGLAFFETGSVVNGTVDFQDLRVVDLT